MLIGVLADTITFRSHHSGPEFVEKRERGLVAAQPELLPELHRRDTGGIRGDQIGSPKPDRQRHLTVLHDRPRREAIVALALATAEDMGSVGEAVRLARLVAPHAAKSVAPTDRLKV